MEIFLSRLNMGVFFISFRVALFVEKIGKKYSWLSKHNSRYWAKIHWSISVCIDVFAKFIISRYIFVCAGLVEHTIEVVYIIIPATLFLPHDISNFFSSAR